MYLFAEKKSQVSNISLCLGFARGLDKKEKCEIYVEENTITIQFQDSHIKYVLDKIKLSPLTCRGLLFNCHGEVQMSLHYEENALESTTTETPQPDSFHTQSKLIQEIQTCGNRMFCCCCGQKLLNNHSIFSRVLPLPSENWSDYADMWFCHKHEGEECKPQGLIPKPDDCLVGTTYIMLKTHHLHQGAITLVGNELECSRCGTCIGSSSTSDKNDDKDVQISKIYLHSTTFSQTDNVSDIVISSQSLNIKLQNYLSQLLLEESRLFTSFRFIISSTDNSQNTVKILVWLLDERLEMYKTTEIVTINTVNTLESDPYCKLLYRVLLSSSKPEDRAIYKLWERDNGVHGINLPYSLCLQFVSLLITSSKSLPKSQRQLNGFNVGLLQLKES